MRARLRAVPAGFWVCFVLATLNACVWAVVTPSFQVPDEIPHVGYVQYLAETGRVPRPFDTTAGHFNPSEEESTAVNGVPFSYVGWPSWDARHSREVQRSLDKPLQRAHEPAAGAAAVYPPLYYALEAIPYKVVGSGSFFDRLLAMRLFSALFAGLTTGFTFLFLRELIPSQPWSWRVGALVVAFQPLAAFVSGGVNPDSLLWAASAAMLWLIARAFRRGLSTRVAIGIGASVAVALLTKGSGASLAPAALLAVAILAWRSQRARVRSAVIAVAVAVLPFLAWLALSPAVFERGAGTGTRGLVESAQLTLGGQISYLWETFLPRLPFMPQEFTFEPTYPLWQSYFQGLVGRFGYAQYEFPMRVNYAALVVAIGVLALVGFHLYRARGALRRRLPELAVYVTLTAAVVVVVAIAGYRFRASDHLNFEQTRYLFPLLALYGALAALAARAGGRRFGPAIGALLVVLAVGQNIFALLLTLQRYYT